MSAAAVAGCGGAQVAAVAGDDSKTVSVGEAVVTYFGQPKPQLLTSAGTVTVVGQVGATFSNVTLQPPPKLDSTYLVVGRSTSNQEALYSISYPSGNDQLLYQSGVADEYPSVSAYGTVAFFSQPSFQMYSVRADGTGLTPIVFSGVTQPQNPVYSNDGTNRLSFFGGTPAGLYIGPGTGGTPTLVQSNTASGTAAWSPTGNRLIFSGYTGTSNNVDLYVIGTSGGAVTDITPVALQNTGEFFSPTWSPDGVDVAATYIANGSSSYEIIRWNMNSPGFYQNVTPSGYDDLTSAFSPDGKKLAVYRWNDGGQTSGVYVEDATGLKQTLLDADPAGDPNSSWYGMSWSPFLPKETVVAASGSTFFHQPASGFLLSESGDQFGSMVAFTATTPAGATIQTPPTTSPSSPLGFIISADSITSIAYINNYFSTGTTLTLSSTPSVVVTIDDASGQVDLVAPSADRKPAMVKNADGTLTYGAAFKALYNSKGQNLAPMGARKLTVDSRTGHLVKFE